MNSLFKSLRDKWGQKVKFYKEEASELVLITYDGHIIGDLGENISHTYQTVITPIRLNNIQKHYQVYHSDSIQGPKIMTENEVVVSVEKEITYIMKQCGIW